MSDTQVLVYLGFLAFAVFGFVCGRINGYRLGHKRGVLEGRRAGAYWERRYWLDPMGPTTPPDTLKE